MWFSYALIGTACWAMVNVLDSMLVHHYERHPVVLMWSQSLFTVSLLFVCFWFLPLETPWMLTLIVVGMVAYLGDLLFFRCLALIDVSVVNMAWVLLSVLLSLVGFLVLSESWTIYQSVGAMLILSGVLLLSLWGKQLPLSHFLLLLGLAFLYAPQYAVQKVSAEAGGYAGTFFWSTAGRECCSILFPLLVPSLRSRVAGVRNMPWSFFGLSFVVVLSFFAGTLLGVLALATGPLSLVSIVSNVQQTMVLLLAAAVCFLLPGLAPKEAFTPHSLRAKIISFFVVFLGLVLLGIS